MRRQRTKPDDYPKSDASTTWSLPHGEVELVQTSENQGKQLMNTKTAFISRLRQMSISLMVALAACSGSSGGEAGVTESSSVETTTPISVTPRTTIPDEPTWVYGTDFLAAGDVFVAPYAQSACDIMRTELLENMDNPQRVTELLAILDEMVKEWGLDAQIAENRQEPSTYTDIWIGAEALLEHFRSLRDGEFVMPMSRQFTLLSCDEFNFTEENSKFAMLP